MAGVRLVRLVERLGLLWCALANLQMLAAALVFRFSTGPTTVPYGLSAPDMQIVAAILVGFGLAGYAAGIGLHERQSWARPLALVLALPVLLEFPVGTALGIYTVSALMPRSAATEYRRLSAACA